MIAHCHLNMAHLLDPGGWSEQARVVADAGSQARLHRRLGGRVPDRRRPPRGSRPCARRCRTTSRSASTSTTTFARGRQLGGGDRGGRDARRHVAGRDRGRRRQLPDRGAGGGARADGDRDRDRPLDAPGRGRPDRPRRDDAAADRDRPADGHDGLRGRARELPPARDPGRRAVRRSTRATIIVELGRRRVVVGQEDAIIGIAAEMAEGAAAGR